MVFTSKIKEGTFEEYYGSDRETIKENSGLLFLMSVDDYMWAMMALAKKLSVDDIGEVWDKLLEPGSNVSIIFNMHPNKTTFSIGDYTCDTCPDNMDFIKFIFSN
jgi:hypothetical protein